MQHIANKTITLEDSKHHMREYDPLENYILQCKKCHVFEHTIMDCKSQNFLCSWCGKHNCNRKCSKDNKKCLNCTQNHSSLYKGCKKYKNEAWKASSLKEAKQKNEKRNILSTNTINLSDNVENLKTSYANIVKNQDNKIDKKIEQSNEKYDKVNSKLDSMTENYDTLFQTMETIKKNLQLIVITTQSTQQKIERIEKDLNDKLLIIDKKVNDMSNEYVDKSSLVVILFESIYALTTQKMMTKMDIMMNLMAIFQRNTGANLDKQKIIKSIEILEQSSLLMSPTEDLSKTKENSSTTNNIKND